MKSQGQLKGLVEKSMAGINDCRKHLQELGDHPGPEDVRAVLDVETRLQLTQLRLFHCWTELESLTVLELVFIGACS